MGFDGRNIWLEIQDNICITNIQIEIRSLFRELYYIFGNLQEKLHISSKSNYTLLYYIG